MTYPIAFDIETGPLPIGEIKERSEPFKPPPPPGEFDPSSVKVGNLSDLTKIRAKLAKAREDHTQMMAGHEAKVKQAETDYWADAQAKAALSPLTGQVLAIGYLSREKDSVWSDLIDVEPETDILTEFWHCYRRCRNNNQQLVGHNIHGFDVPFIIRRSWVHNLAVPDTVFERQGRYLDSIVFVDTMKLWACGGREFVKLNKLAKLFDVGGKSEGLDGSMFADLFANDRPKAIEYLRNHVEMTLAIAEYMGII